MDELAGGPAEQEGLQEADGEGDGHCGICAAALPASGVTVCCECEVACCAACAVLAGDTTACRACAVPGAGEAAEETARAEAGARGEVVEAAAGVVEWG